jgi:hypothetical protein
MPHVGTLRPWEILFQNRLAIRRKKPPTDTNMLKDYADVKMNWNLRERNNRQLNYSTLVVAISLFSRNFNWDFVTHFIGATKVQIKNAIEDHAVLVLEMDRAIQARNKIKF